MIVKLQRPIAPPDAPILIYDGPARTMTTTMRADVLPKDVEVALRLSSSTKIYWYADLDDEVLIFKDRAPSQNW